MNDTKQPIACNCTTCPGPSCTCGCQKASRTKPPAPAARSASAARAAPAPSPESSCAEGRAGGEGQPTAGTRWLRPSFKLLGYRMNTFVLAFFGGIVGAVLMDITETAAARIGITSGVNVALVGRWFLGLTRGRLAHADILTSPSLPGEAGLGWAFHFLIGGGGVALIYPAVLLYHGR